jgi:ketosteroid isomerase-like protein
MHAHAALLTRFYEAFARRDGAAMAACYHPDVVFSDPVFPRLTGEQPGAMWRMLTGRSPRLRVEFRDVTADGERGSVHWEAWYPFGPRERNVHNLIDARFRFRDGLIREHLDHFDLARWAAQGLGLVGGLLGWSPLLRFVIRRKAAGQLAAFMKRT